MKASLVLVSAALALSASFVAAQATPAPAPQSAVAPAPAAATAPASATASVVPLNGKYELHDGDDIPLKFAQDLSSKTAMDGEPVNFVLDGDIKVGDVVVIKSKPKR